MFLAQQLESTIDCTLVLAIETGQLWREMTVSRFVY